MISKNCIVCNKAFLKLPSHSKKYWATRRFCSCSCGSKYHIDSRIKDLMASQRAALKKRGEHWRKGKKQSPEHIAKLSKIRKGRAYSDARRIAMDLRLAALPRGARVLKVKQQIKASNLYKDWRISVLRRDGFCCVDCGYKSHKKINGRPDIQADHIFPFAEIFKKNKINSFLDAKDCSEFWDVSNGRTLCLSCHKEKTIEYLSTGLYKKNIYAETV